MINSAPPRITVLALAAALVGPACLGEGRDRASLDLEVGASAAGGVVFAAVDGLAHVRDVGDGYLDLWASAPAFEITATSAPSSTTEWIITVDNCMPDAELVAVGSGSDPAPAIEALDDPDARPVVRQWRVQLPDAGETRLRVAPADADVADSWRFAAMGDIQEALGEVHEVFARIGEEPDIRFVLSTGDLVDRANPDEYEQLVAQYHTLDVPYYTTIGNHELFGDHQLWRDHFGRFNVHFEFKGVSFSLVDSGNASIHPVVYEWLGEWLDDAADRVHIFGTHYPPTDPVGIRDGSFRSRKEAAKLLGRLASSDVDLTLYGHIHSYYEYENAGIPAYISGGGGALPERLDGIGRHFLMVDVTAEEVECVTVVRVD